MNRSPEWLRETADLLEKHTKLKLDIELLERAINEAPTVSGHGKGEVRRPRVEMSMSYEMYDIAKTPMAGGYVRSRCIPLIELDGIEVRGLLKAQLSKMETELRGRGVDL